MQQNNSGSGTCFFRDYERIAKLFYSGATFVAFDTETTGLESKNDYLTEIGAVKFNYGGEISTFDQLIKPPVPIPPFLENLTHITNQMVQDCPDASTVLRDFLYFLGDKKTILIAHNAPFDLGFINAQMERMGQPNIQNMTIDTLPLTRWTYPQFRNESEKGQYKLQSLAKRFNIEVRSAHRADDDARVLREIFVRTITDSLPRQKNFDATMIPKNPPSKEIQLELF